MGSSWLGRLDKGTADGTPLGLSSAGDRMQCNCAAGFRTESRHWCFGRSMTGIWLASLEPAYLVQEAPSPGTTTARRAGLDIDWTCCDSGCLCESTSVSQVKDAPTPSQTHSLHRGCSSFRPFKRALDHDTCLLFGIDGQRTENSPLESL